MFYFYIALVGIILGMVVMLLNDEKPKDKIMAALGLCAGGLFLYGLVTSVAFILA